jgi:hypothetical protein
MIPGTYQSPQIAAPGVAAPAGTCLLFAGADGRWYVITPASATALPVGNELFLDNGTLNINAAIAAVALFAATLFGALRAKIIAAAGAGAYEADYFLPVTNMLAGASVRLMIELPASANPTIEIFNASGAGTLLKTISTPNAGAAAAYWWGIFGFGKDGAWHLDACGWNM